MFGGGEGEQRERNQDDAEHREDEEVASLVADGVPVDERSAVLVASDGRAEVVGAGKGAYFIRPTGSPEVCSPGRPLSFRGLKVYNAPAGTHFDLHSWKGRGGVDYQLSVVNGKIESTRSNGSAY